LTFSYLYSAQIRKRTEFGDTVRRCSFETLLRCHTWSAHLWRRYYLEPYVQTWRCLDQHPTFWSRLRRYIWTLSSLTYEDSSSMCYDGKEYVESLSKVRRDWSATDRWECHGEDEVKCIVARSAACNTLIRPFSFANTENCSYATRYQLTIKCY